MPTASFFNAIKTQLQVIDETNNTPSFVQLWNNQLASLKAVDTEANILYSFSLPAFFIEFLNLETEQLGNGNQVYPNLIVRIHILHRLEDAGNGTMEQDLAVLELRDAVQTALQNFRPAGASEFTRQKQQMDYSHNNIYHYIIEYGCAYIDTLTAQPVNGIIANPPFNLVLDKSYNPPPYMKPPADFNSEDFDDNDFYTN